MKKYIFISGGVMSGIGKGITAASIGKILQVRDIGVSIVKIDPYLNADAGTMNPYTHGEVFVTEDGGETDMDLGTYERFLDTNLSKEHNITTGQIYLSVIGKEREGKFLGRCVQIIPHITDEIKNRLRKIATKNTIECLIVEIGGTVGDIESLPFLEAARQMKMEIGQENVLNVHVTLVPVLTAVGEQKTKPTQHSVQELRRIGIQPDIIIPRSKKPLLKGPKKKIALFCNVEDRAVFNSPDLENIYESPLILDNQNLGNYICKKLKIHSNEPNWINWKQIIRTFIEQRRLIKIAICGKYAEFSDSYVSVNEALKHSGAALETKINLDWIETEIFEKNISKLKVLSKFDGILIPGGFGIRGTEGKIAAIKYARNKDIPFLGICLGFQLAVVEFSRQIGLDKANSAENNPRVRHPVIDLMPEQKKINTKGASMRLGTQEVILSPRTLAYKLYNKKKIFERHRHRYEVNPNYINLLEKNGIIFSGKSSDGLRMEILEIPNQLFHLATQFHGEFKSRPGKPAPSYYGFVEACLRKKTTRIKNN
ncbi:MAG: CTP synthase (glutamine hydrolyzing) [Candidatus Bathyarchaeota archaeon]|nr:CTP synthase (glutamine hydrolyzing) [Candidatus Bathyarchaeota archaeon]